MTIDYQNIVFPSAEAKNKIDKLVSGKVAFPAAGTTGILLYGDVGTGKSTVASAIPHELQKNIDPDLKAHVDPVQIKKPKNSVDFLRDLHNGLMLWSAGTYHYCVLNEIDNLTPDAMKQLKCYMDEVGNNVVWIFTTNHRENVERTIRDRCHEIDYNPSSPLVWVPFIRQKLGLKVARMTDHDILKQIIVPSGNNIRKIIANIAVL